MGSGAAAARRSVACRGVLAAGGFEGVEDREVRLHHGPELGTELAPTAGGGAVAVVRAARSGTDHQGQGEQEPETPHRASIPDRPPPTVSLVVGTVRGMARLILTPFGRPALEALAGVVADVPGRRSSGPGHGGRAVRPRLGVGAAGPRSSRGHRPGQRSHPGPAPVGGAPGHAARLGGGSASPDADVGCGPGSGRSGRGATAAVAGPGIGGGGGGAHPHLRPPARGQRCRAPGAGEAQRPGRRGHRPLPGPPRAAGGPPRPP